MTASDADRAHMARALELAARGLYTTTPNPRVGCVIARGGTIVGEGFHARAGEAHAEVAALADAARRGADVRGATLYVDARAVQSPRAHAAVRRRDHRCGHRARRRRDGASRGSGRPRAARRACAPPASSSTSGCSRTRRASSNRASSSRITRGRPWVRIKVAASLDGRTALANGESQWITGEQARADGHAWRARACAILTGIGTVLQDDPALTVRAVETPRQPRRVVVDRQRADAGERSRARGRRRADRHRGRAQCRVGRASVEWLALPDGSGRVDLPALMKVLASRGINELHVEAGAKLNGALLDAGLVDEILLYVAPAVLGDPGARAVRARHAARRARGPRANSRGTTSSGSATTCGSSRDAWTRKAADVHRHRADGGSDRVGRAARRRRAHRHRHRRSLDGRRHGRRQRRRQRLLPDRRRHRRRDVVVRRFGGDAALHDRASTGRATSTSSSRLRLSDRLGGHLMTGHVDGIGTVRAFAAVPADAQGSCPSRRARRRASSRGSSRPRGRLPWTASA